MLKLFRNNKPVAAIVLIVLTFVFKWQILIQPILPVVSQGHFLFSFIYKCTNAVLLNSSIGFSILAIIVHLIQTFYINYIASKHKLFLNNSLIPGFTYLLLSSFFPSLNFFSESLLINFFVLAGIDTMLSFNHTQNPRTQIFNAGFLMCIPALFQFSAIGFFLIFILALALLRPFHPAEWVVGAIGFFTPVYFLIALLFLFDQLETLKHFPLLSFSHFNKTDFTGLRLGVFAGIIMLTCIGLFSLQQLMSKVTIYVRRSWLLLVCYSIIAFFVIFLAYPTHSSQWIIIIPPLSLIISQSFCLEKPKRISSFTFYFSLLLFIISQYTFFK